MVNESTTEPTAKSAWRVTQVYAMAVICLLVGLAIGYLFRGSKSPAPQPAVPETSGQSSPHTGAMGGMSGKKPSLEDMKKMADKKAAPLLEKLKSDPTNTSTIMQIGAIYKATHQFKEAGEYYDQALKVDPKNVAARSEYASTLYYNGDVDGAIAQLNQALHDDPKDANSLFNLGMIKWKGKHDSKGALAAWQQLLRTNPQLSADRKATVQKLIADVQMQGKS